MSKKVLFVLATSAVLLTGCLISESFKAKTDFAANGGYTFSYAGTAVHAMPAAEEKQTSSILPKDEDGLKAEAVKMRKDPMVQSAECSGNHNLSFWKASAEIFIDRCASIARVGGPGLAIF